MAACSTAPLKRKHKTWVRRSADRIQWVRRAGQLGFLALNVWIGVQFYLFVRFYESGGRTVWASRPPGVEGWLPIASLMNLKYWVVTGRLPAVHPAGMFLLLAFVGVSLLARKAFCGWMCPVGTVSEYLWKAGRKLFRRNFTLPRWVDLPLRGAKYLLLGLFSYAVVTMSADAIAFFLEGPYGVIADVKLLNFFRTLSGWGAAVVAGIAVASMLVQNFWCRYLCPYGALMGLASWWSPVKIRRDAELCIDCAKCAKACPSQLAVDRLIQINSPECLGCMECVTACPVDRALELTAPRVSRVPAWAVAAMLTVVFLGTVGYARHIGYWHTNVPSDVYFRLIPNASEFGHP
jgi:polyferredoxin